MPRTLNAPRLWTLVLSVVLMVGAVSAMGAEAAPSPITLSQSSALSMAASSPQSRHNAKAGVGRHREIRR